MNENLDDDHDYHFVGKVGSFCPMKPGSGGGLLLREKDGKYYAATGSKGYRWMESEMVKVLEKEGDIDRDYYDTLVNEAVQDISKYGDIEWFISNDTELMNELNLEHHNDMPPWLMPCGRETCTDCPDWRKEGDTRVCDSGYECLPF
jgi:hypothetical protein